MCIKLRIIFRLTIIIWMVFYVISDNTILLIWPGFFINYYIIIYIN